MRADGTGSHTYQWDAENRLASVDGVAGQACQTTWTACYTYNALGQRVEKKVGSAYTEILYDGYGYVTAFHDRTTWSQLFIPSVGGRQIMKYQDTVTYFLHTNLLGSTGMITNHAGTPTQDVLYYPWGQRWAYQGSLRDERFASLGQRDAENMLDPTLFRMYTSNQGRWLSPDPMPGSVLNPQSLNRYAYVLNNPTNLIDLLGLQEPCTVANGCRDPHVVSHEPGLALSFGNCTLDYVPINCGALLQAIGAGITNVQPIGISGNTITATTVECTWSESTGRVCTSGVATFTLPDLGTALDNAYGKALGALGQFFRGRPKGQSFGACVGANASLTLTGSTDSPIATTVAAVVPVVVSTALLTQRTTVFGRQVSLYQYLAAITAVSARAFSGGLISVSGAISVGKTTARGILIAGAAGAGLIIGSVANCASEGVSP